MNPIIFSIWLFVIPCIISYFLSLKLGRKGKNAVIIVSALGIISGIISMNYNLQATEAISEMTGYYNLEAIGFYAFYMVLVSAGIFTGQILNKKKKDR